MKHKEEVFEKAATDVVKGRTTVFLGKQAQEIKGLQISPVGVVEGKEIL